MMDLEDVDRVLAGLGAVEPGAGMEARVLLALEQAGMRCLRPPARRGEFWPRASREWLTAARITAAVLLMMSPVVMYTVRRGATRRAAGVTAASQGVPRVVGSSAAAPRAAEPGAVELRADSHTNPHAAGVVGELPVVRGFPSGPVSARKEMAVALALASAPDARVESFPAPSMPLTRQERLLLRMLDGGQTAELMATLSAGAEQAMEARDGAQRLEFFSRPRPVQALKSDEPEQPDVDAVGHMGPVVATPADTKETHAK